MFGNRNNTDTYPRACGMYDPDLWHEARIEDLLREELIKFREEFELRQQDLAKILDVSEPTIAKHSSVSEMLPAPQLWDQLVTWGLLPSRARVTWALRLARRWLDYVNEDVAVLMGVSSPTVTRWERVSPPRRVDQVAQLLDLLGLGGAVRLFGRERPQNRGVGILSRGPGARLWIPPGTQLPRMLFPLHGGEDVVASDHPSTAPAEPTNRTNESERKGRSHV